MENKLKTGTTTLGIVCKDGLVLAADRRATAGNLIVAKDISKVYPISDNLVITIAGSVSDVQLLTKLLKAQIKIKELGVNRKIQVKEAVNLLSTMVYQNIRQMFPGVAHFIVAGKDTEGFHLYDIFPDGSIQYIKDYISSGSGSVFAYGVLETLFQPEMTVEDGTKLAVRSLTAALQRDSASGNGIDVYNITKEGIVKKFEQEVNAKPQI